mmetsp:Transcript_113568/g.253351  ORF Transcript_113568/g.253351 Transcript_113568/m.253351 type:complete len:285 (+) Transcript_113568:3-857(+)
MAPECSISEASSRLEQQVELRLQRTEQHLEERLEVLATRLLESQRRLVEAVESEAAAGRRGLMVRMEELSVAMATGQRSVAKALESHGHRIEALQGQVSMLGTASAAPDLSGLERAVEALAAEQRQLRPPAAGAGSACSISASDAAERDLEAMEPPKPLPLPALEEAFALPALPMPADADADPRKSSAQAASAAARGAAGPLPGRGRPAEGPAGDRVAEVHLWVSQQGLSRLPFDKLVLHLDRLGVELSIPEQDRLKRCLLQSGSTLEHLLHGNRSCPDVGAVL